MTKSDAKDPRIRLRGWVVAIFAIAIWLILATNSAEAQEVRIPDFVLKQVLGKGSSPSVLEPVATPPVDLVADRMNQNLRDQLIAGVPRPSVELEVHFEWDSAEIHDQSSPEIRAAAELLNRHFPVTRFRLVGFTDQSGDADYNQLLSERRASAVWRALVEEHGVAAERLGRIGFGERDPAGDSSDAQRRRVELQIVRGDAQPF